MSFVNKKIFGSDIDSKIKQKLELLQLAAGNSVPNELTEGKEFSTSRYVKAGEPAYKIEDLLPVPEALSTSKQFLSQRTPFARMWTSLMLSKHVKTDVNDVGVSPSFFISCPSTIDKTKNDIKKYFSIFIASLIYF